MHKWAIWLTCTAAFLAACQPAATAAPPLPTVTASPAPTDTPEPTVVWFPATATHTPFPTPVVTPTALISLDLGPVLYEDTFDTPAAWDIHTLPDGQISLADGRLSLAVTGERGFLFSVRQSTVLTDFYAEITARTSLCMGADEFGLMLRVTGDLDYYRYSLSCDGRVRLDRINQGAAAALQAWIPGGIVPPGAPGSARLGAWVVGDVLQLFVDGQLQFSVKDPLIQAGSIGVFARAAENSPVTVSFSDLQVWAAGGSE